MTLGGFLDAAFAALVEEYRRLGADLQSALAELDDYRAGGPTVTRDDQISSAAAQAAENHRSEAAQALQNERALAELQKMMASTGKSFG